MRYPMRFYIAVVTVVWLGVLVACTPTGTEPIATGRPVLTETVTSTPETGAGQALLARLAGTEWELVSWGPADNPIMARPNAEVTAEFGEEWIAIELGCNVDGTDLVVDGDDLRLDDDWSGATELWCPGDRVMAQEEVISQALLSAEIIQLEDGSLVVPYGRGTLRYREILPQPDNTLEDKVFWLTEVEIGGVVQTAVSSTVVLAEFVRGQVRGFAGCNDYNGIYSMSAESISFQEIITSHESCLDSQRSEQEENYLNGLNTTERYSLRGGNLTLYSPNGSLRFREMSFVYDGVQEYPRWRLVSFSKRSGVQPLLPGTEITFSFVATEFEAPRAQGSAGCNEYDGVFNFYPNMISEVWDIVTTERMCTAEVMEQEVAFLRALESAWYVALDGRLLFVYPGGVLVFEPVMGE